MDAHAGVHIAALETVREADRAPLRLAPAEVIPRARSEAANRVLNVALASIALFLLSPLLILVAAAIKLTSRGPIFYLQTRVGLDRRWNRTHAMYDRRTQNLGGSVFTIYKFRSMYVNAEHDGRAVWAAKQDARVTPVGRVLRQFRLDEIPQLINVLKGDMNIVGPRPERPSIFVRLRSDIADYPLRQRAKPGITGWAQINQSYDSCMDDVRRKVGFDLEYIQRQSLLEDVMGLARLQAGREQLVVKRFDAAALIKDVAGRLHGVMDERGLSFEVEGPAVLTVEGDAVKVQRIAQNLLLNAFKYTERGGVVVSYGDSRNNDEGRWMLSVQDTGPGFAAGPGAPLAGAIESATDESRAVDVAAGGNSPEHQPLQASPRRPALPVYQEHGEGIGLSIVKRLCELLNATIELDSVPGRGTTVRVLFPRAYGGE